MLLDNIPQRLNRVEIWRRGWMGKKRDTMFMEPFDCALRMMRTRAILLKNEIWPVLDHQVTKLEQGTIESLFSIVFCIKTTTFSARIFQNDKWASGTFHDASPDHAAYTAIAASDHINLGNCPKSDMISKGNCPSPKYRAAGEDTRPWSTAQENHLAYLSALITQTHSLVSLSITVLRAETDGLDHLTDLAWNGT
ncbi:hypothetical protein BT96DRAFT_935044 [Gymnopus androsaceus JB14]|uniref:Uncharacterized protein n=1 Tax=Gymnopus androsaceus JB14 TaxID=1447944 RepID=A0A6A4I604_9AGAR|nr:hypothetical protein BT96DRAFT_935044 [Gymnopus androsaceus JB14]